MPKWAGKWKGGRYYVQDDKPVFFIERRVSGVVRPIKLQTNDPDLALGDLARFERDPVAFYREHTAPPPAAPAAVTLTAARLKLYMDSIHDCAKDHRAARRSDLLAWGNYSSPDGKPLDLRTADKKTLRLALASFAPDGPDRRRTGGFKRRAEALNAFCNFLVSEGDLASWSPLAISAAQRPAQRRAERVAYTPDAIRRAWLAVQDQAIRDVIQVRVSTGMHDTEIQQLAGAKLWTGPLPETHPRSGPGYVRTSLERKHEIVGVLQIRQKTKPRHRISVNAETLAAVLRLQVLKDANGNPRIPSRFDTYNACCEVGIIPSNLRHTFTTLRGLGQIVHYEEGGVSLDQVAEIMGHRVGSSMTGSRYDKLQVPALMRLPLNWDLAGVDTQTG